MHLKKYLKLKVVRLIQEVTTLAFLQVGCYEKNTVEGSNNKLHMIPLTNKLGSKFIHIAPKSNMLVGFDQMGDMESVDVREFAPFVLTYIATMFFGVQFESIDRRRLKVIELATSAQQGQG